MRSIIETINDQLKNIFLIVHSRHRPFQNFLNNILADIIDHSFLPLKPRAKLYEFVTDNSGQLLFF